MNINWDVITLFVLALFSLRDLIFDNLDIERSELPGWIRWFAKRKEPILCQGAYRRQQELRHLPKKGDIVIDLIDMCSKHVSYFSGGLRHGRSQIVESEYFINTLEASHDKQDLHTMKQALKTLVAESKQDYDFILCLKTGNQLLAHSISDSYGDVVHVCRIDERINHAPKVDSASDMDKYKLEFENLGELLQHEKAAKRKLKGIVVDCSTSTGNGIMEAIKSFNQLVVDEELNICPIQHAYVLIAHNLNIKVDQGVTLYRYFDTDEETRKLIYDMNDPTKNVGSGDVYAHLKEKNLLYENKS